MRWPRLSAEILALLITLSPLIGVVTTLFVKRWNTSLIRPMALSNSAITLLLACTAVWVHTDLAVSGRSQHQQAEPGIGWLAESRPDQPANIAPSPGIQVRLSLSGDGLSAWSALLLSLIVWATLCSSTQLEGPVLSSQCIGLMTGQALLLASCFATDAIAAIVFLEAALLPIYLLITTSSEDGRRPIAGAWWIGQVIGSSSTLAGVTMLAVAQPWMQADLVPSRGTALFETSLLADSLRQLLSRSETAWHLWSHLAPWAAALMLLGLLIRLPVFPFLGWYQSALMAAPPGISGVISIAFPLAALCGWLRLGLPLFAVNSSVVTGILSVVSLVGILQCAWELQSQVDLKRILAMYSCAMLCLAGVGLSLQNQDGVMGAWLLVLSQGLVVAGGMLLVQILEGRFGTRDLTRLSDLAKKVPRLQALLGLLLLGLAAIPIVSGYSAVTLQLSASTGASWWLIAGVSVAIVAVATAAIRAFAVVITPTASQGSMPNVTSIDDARTDISRSELFAIAPILALILMLNIAPTIAIASCETTIRRLFHRAEQRTADLLREPTDRH